MWPRAGIRGFLERPGGKAPAPGSLADVSSDARMLKVIRRIIANTGNFSSADVFEGLQQLSRLRAQVGRLLLAGHGSALEERSMPGAAGAGGCNVLPPAPSVAFAFATTEVAATACLAPAPSTPMLRGALLGWLARHAGHEHPRAALRLAPFTLSSLGPFHPRPPCSVAPSWPRSTCWWCPPRRTTTRCRRYW